MHARKILLSTLTAATLSGAVALPLQAAAAVGIYVNIAPPPPQIEVLPPPRFGYVWVPGYWEWRMRRHVWVQGHWLRERPGYLYQPHRWVERDGRWYLERGHWDNRGRGDRDHDGVPNRYDRHPNDPYRR